MAKKDSLQHNQIKIADELALSKSGDKTLTGELAAENKIKIKGDHNLLNQINYHYDNTNPLNSFIELFKAHCEDKVQWNIEKVKLEKKNQELEAELSELKREVEGIWIETKNIKSLQEVNSIVVKLVQLGVYIDHSQENEIEINHFAFLIDPKNPNFYEAVEYINSGKWSRESQN